MGPLLLTILALAAPLEVQTRTLKRASGREALQLPFVVGEGVAVERMNIVLYLTLLSQAPPAADATLKDDGDGMWYKTLGFTVARNDDRLLELSVDGESCGTTCEPIHYTLAFDVRTGRSIDLRDVFTPAALESLAARMRAERVRRYQELVRRYARYKEDRFSELGNKLTFNEGCLKLELKNATRIESVSAAFGVKSVTVTAERCSNQAMRQYDDVGDVSVTFAYGDAKLPMTAYGKSLLLGTGDAEQPTSPFGQTLRGSIGIVAITAVLERPNPDGTFNGRYFYDRRRKTIPLHGRVEKDGTIQLAESSSTHFTLKLVGATLTGKGVDKNDTTEMRLEPR